VTTHETSTEPWSVTLVDTGEETATGGRLKRIARYVKDEEDFCFTYGDGVSDIDIGALIAFHRRSGALATVTAAQPPGRFGVLTLSRDRITEFREKPAGEGGRINGGYFVLSPKVLDYIAGDATAWEREPMERLAAQSQLAAFVHDGFWQALDTLRDKTALNEMWAAGNAPWKVWD
jgi:glucose-1-phosphate cytidylyltransferase